jgi:molecular chaperone DnaK
MSYRLGVDLGTTFTAAAVANGMPATMIGLGNRALQIPSVLFLEDDGAVVVGEAAERRGLARPDRVVREFKRRIGDTVPMLVAGTPYSPQSLTARLLEHVVATATERMGEAPSEVVLTHPANWGPYKLELLEQVARLAGVERAVLCPEPLAAAAQYAAQARVSVGDTIVVYDLGGGTFDACVLQKTPDGFALLGSPEGIEHLGGIDFDEALFQHVLTLLGDRLVSLDPDEPDTVVGLNRLRRDCVEAKEALSVDTDTLVPVALPGLSSTLRLTRNEFETLIRPALTDTIGALQRAIRSADLTPEQLSAIVLVGGSSRIPLIGELLHQSFPTPTAMDTHPKHDIALGAVQVEPGGFDLGSPPPMSTLRSPRTDQPTAGSRRSTAAAAGAAAAGAALGGEAAAAAPEPGAGDGSASIPPEADGAPHAPSGPYPTSGPSPAPPQTSPTSRPADLPEGGPGTPGSPGGDAPPPLPPTPDAAASGEPPAADSGIEGGTSPPDPSRRRRLILLAAGAAAVVAGVVIGIAVVANRGDVTNSEPSDFDTRVPSSTSPATPTPSPTPSPSPTPDIPRSEPIGETQMIIQMQQDDTWNLWLADTTSAAPVRQLTTSGSFNGAQEISSGFDSMIYVHEDDKSKSSLRVAGIQALEGDRELFPLPKGCRQAARTAWDPVNPNRLAVACTDAKDQYLIQVMTIDGELVRRVDPPEGMPKMGDVVFSADGTHLTFWAAPADSKLDGGILYTVPVDGGTPKRLIKNDTPEMPGSDADPTYSPDGRYVAFRRRLPAAADRGQYDIFRMKVDGTDLTRLTKDSADEQNPSWSRDSKQIAYKSGAVTKASPDTFLKIFVMTADGKKQRPLWTKGTFGPQALAAWTPR